MIYVAWVALGVSALVAFANIAGCASAVIVRSFGIDRSYSCVPFISLLCAVLSWSLGRETLGFWTFVPALLDPGNWMLLVLPFFLSRPRGPAETSDLERHESQSRPPIWLLLVAAWTFGDRMSRSTAQRLLGPMASHALQRKYVVDGRPESYATPEDLIASTNAFVERLRHGVLYGLPRIRELAHVLENVSLELDDPALSKAHLIDVHAGWAAVREAARAVLDDLDTDFEQWERQELRRP